MTTYYNTLPMSNIIANDAGRLEDLPRYTAVSIVSFDYVNVILEPVETIKGCKQISVSLEIFDRFFKEYIR